MGQYVERGGKSGRIRQSCAVLCVALMCAMGTIQATHTHAENSTTSHHSCSICATAHAGFNTQTVASAPVLRTAALTTFVAEAVSHFPSCHQQFIRPRQRSDPASVEPVIPNGP